MFIAVSAGVAARDQGIASGVGSTGTQIGAAAGLTFQPAAAGEENADDH